MDNPGFQNDAVDRDGFSSSTRSRQKTSESFPMRSTVVEKYDSEVADRFPPRGATAETASGRIEIPRTVGLFSASAFIIGTVIGSGIFVSPKGVLIGSGSVGLTLIIWILCGFFSLMGALAYSELGTLIPESGGAFVYFLHALAPNRKDERSWWREVIPFLYQWQNVIFIKPASLAVQGLTSGTYLIRLGLINCVNDDKGTEGAIRWLAAFLILIICFINCYSISWSTKVQNIFSSAKVIALLLVICGGIYQLSIGEVGILNTGFEGTTNSYSGISAAFYSGLWAYGGWDNLNYVTKEIKNPKRNLPWALIASIIFITVIYTFTNASYFSVLTKEEIFLSDAVAESFGLRLAGVAGAVIMVFSVACSTSGSANGGLFQSGRLVHVAASEGHMLDFLSYIHIKKFTPCPAIIFTSLMALIFIMADIFSLISLTGFVEWIFMGFAMIALLHFRKTKKDVERTITVPLFVPIIVILFSLFLVITPFIDNPTPKFAFVLAMELVGVLVYTLFVYYKFTIPGLGHLKTFVQKLLLVVPCD